MKKQDLLRIKAAIIAVALALSLNACTKKALGKPVKKEENKSASIFQSNNEGSYVYPDSYNS